ncbi:MAG: hypothetical protein NVSMB52_10410 [Chloroflexota bacterium]
MNGSDKIYNARTLCLGTGTGELLILDAPLSFWGGMDRMSGRVIDPHHPQNGEVLAGKIVAMPSGRGSSSSSSVLAEVIRAGCAPAGLILHQVDGIIAVGAIVAGELYGRYHPVIELDWDLYRTLRSRTRVRVVAGGDKAVISVEQT